MAGDRIRTVFLVISLVSLTPLSGGCVHQMEGPEQAVRLAASADTGVRSKLNNVGLLTPGLSGQLAVEKQGMNRTQVGTWEVWVILRNRTGATLAVQARTAFHHRGTLAPAETPSAWQTIYLAPNATHTYRCLSMVREEPSYYVEIRTEEE